MYEAEEVFDVIFISGHQAAEVVPDLPTIAESGVPGFQSNGCTARTPGELRKLLAREGELWGKLIRDAGIKAD